jgi:two-component system nitrogen regulation sensor histidine kinase NtrY
VAEGDFGFRILTPSRDELASLVESFNVMIAELDGSRRKLIAAERITAWQEIARRLAHEIRNPLTGLKLHLQLLAERIDARESGRVERLLTEVQRLELLVSSTLLLGGEQPLDLATTRVRVLIAEVVDLMGPSLAHLGIRVDSRCDEGLQARIDRGRVRQALLNLIVNAADAMPQGGALRISAEQDAAASRVLIRVEDTGPGLSEDVRARLSDSPVSTKPFGLGLGMTVCREVAAAHGGELQMERSSELGGACFVLAFPLSVASSPPSTDD